MGMNPRYGNWGSAEWAGRAGTVGELQAQGWPVVARCARCDLEMEVRLAVVEEARGKAFSLWGRHTRCRRRHCLGRMLFYTYPPQAGGARVQMF